MSPRHLVGFLIVLSGLGGCASAQAPAASSAAAAAAACSEPKDRAAIAAMAGSYEVSFDFEETDVLTPGYEKHQPLHTGGTELVIALENVPGRVSLQHILVIGTGSDASLVKHWRQDWVFEDRELWEFQGKNVWLKRTVSPSAAHCTWSQAVFEVDDAPRYESSGRWLHDEKGSLWQSARTWRPLPRREYSKRDDYDVLLGVNRHRITSVGWQHEQDNEKLILEPRHSLVRETGVNHYTHVDPAATEPAAKYWREASAFWALVRAEWQRQLSARSRLETVTEVDGQRLYDPLFDRLDSKTRDVAGDAAFIHETIGKYIKAYP